MLKLKAVDTNVHEVEFTDINKGWEQWILLSADRHWDNPQSDHAFQKKHLELAKARNAGILDFGDLFCVMQSEGDKRGHKSAVRKEHARADNYLDVVVDDCAEALAPYPFWVIGKGNHDTKMLKYHNTDLIARLVEKMHVIRGTKHDSTAPTQAPFTGGFSGWVVFRFKVRGTVRITKRLFYHHGYGGDAPVTKGVIQTNRMAVYLPDADLVCTGHTHNEWQFPIARLRINQSSRVTKDDQLHLKIPSYKDEYGKGEGGWEIERGAPPKTQGAVWLRFWYDSSDKAVRDGSVIKFEATRAQ